MRTARALTVSPSKLCTRGCTGSWGVYLVGGCTWFLGVYLVLGGLPGPQGCTWLGGPGPGGVPDRGCIWSGAGCTCSGGCTCSQGVYCIRECIWSRGDVPGLGGVPGLGVYLVPGGVPDQAPPQTRYSPPGPGQVLPPWTESQTPVKT